MKTVLLVEDDVATRDVLARLLRRDGWEVLEAEDGETGIRLALEHRPRLVLCDLLMPRCNGFQVCRAVRQQLQPARVIVTSGQDYPIDRLNAQEAGASHYLVKPIDWQELRALIADLAEPAADEGAAAGAIRPPQPTRLCFWGVRGSIPTPGPTTVHYGGNTSCVEVRADGELIILDAGTGLRALGLALAAEFADRPLLLTLLLTHTHWDHIQGLPFFLPAYEPKNRLRILGYEGARASLATVLSGQMESPYFPINLKQMPGHLLIEEQRDLEFSIGPVSVRAKFVNHPGVCVGYRLQTSGGVIAYLPDNEPFGRLRAQQQQQQGGGGAAATLPAAAAPAAGESPLDFARAEDRKLVEFIQGADVLIIDSQYDCEEYVSHVGWGHGCVDDVIALALEAGVRQLFLFHHDPSHSDRKITSMLAGARALVTARGAADRLTVDAAREGEEFVLPLPASRRPNRKSDAQEERERRAAAAG